MAAIPKRSTTQTLNHGASLNNYYAVELVRYCNHDSGFRIFVRLWGFTPHMPLHLRVYMFVCQRKKASKALIDFILNTHVTFLCFNDPLCCKAQLSACAGKVYSHE